MKYNNLNLSRTTVLDVLDVSKDHLHLMFHTPMAFDYIFKSIYPKHSDLFRCWQSISSRQFIVSNVRETIIMSIENLTY